MKTIVRYLSLLALPVLCASILSAQSSFDFNAGVGAMAAKSNGRIYDTFGNGSLFRTPSLNSVFLGVGGALMLNKSLGFGFEAELQPHRPDYAGLKIRNTFYDAHAIYQPFSAKRAALQLKGGIGGVNNRFYYSQTGCGGFTGCSTVTQFVDSSNHFQVHGGAGVQVFLTDHVFIRPQMDIHYVRNFQQYGTNWVPAATVWVGYSIGER